jgi:hypothetical protein
MVYDLGVKAVFFLRYGGEAITYLQDDKVTIYDIYREIKKEKL